MGCNRSWQCLHSEPVCAVKAEPDDDAQTRHAFNSKLNMAAGNWNDAKTFKLIEFWSDNNIQAQ